jgi:drug/metabolite transporter (DMT)-like permease
MFLSGFIASSIMNSARDNWKAVATRPKYLLIVGVLGIVGNDIFYVLSFKYAPAVQADLIVYLWPILVLILSSVLLNEEVRFNHIFACLIAFSGVYLLLASGENTNIFDQQYFFGYFCAFMSAFLWSIYVIISRKYLKSTPELFAVYCGVGSIFSISMHFCYEITIIPSFWQGLVLAIMGVTTHSLAYYAWDFAIKKGHFKLLSILPYGNPILSVVALAIFGFAELTETVLVSTLMVFIAGIIGSIRFKKRRATTKTPIQQSA